MMGSSEESQPLLHNKPHDSPEEEPEKGICSFIPARHALVAMAFLGFFNIYALRVNLSVALVAMVNSTAPDSNVSVIEQCPDNTGNHSSDPQDSPGEFDWDQNTQGLILGAFFYGYIITQIPGGWLAERVGGKRLFGLAVLCTSVLTLLTPVAARAGLPVLVTLRVLEGIGEGVSYPAMHAMLAVWAPVYERSKLTAYAYGGSMVGTVVAMPVSGILCKSGFAGGWPSVFYVFGSVGCVWSAFWMLLIHDTPSQHPRISAKEKHYILRSIGKKEHIPTPWFHILTSSALWGVAAAHFANAWGGYGMLTSLPTYMKKVLHFDIQQDGLLSALPFLASWVFQLVSGWIADFIRYRGYLSTAATRKVMTTLGCAGPAILMVLASYAGCNKTLAVVFLTLGVGTSGICIGGYSVNHLDIAPRFAGTLLGITNTVATISGFVTPQVIGLLTNHEESIERWRIFFFITAGIYTAGILLFIIFAQGEEQWWAKGPDSVRSGLNQEKIIPAPSVLDPEVTLSVSQNSSSIQEVSGIDREQI